MSSSTSGGGRRKKKIAVNEDDIAIGKLSGAGSSDLVRLQPSQPRSSSDQSKKDLTFGKVQKRTFSPIIPTSRKIKKEPVDVDVMVAKKQSFKEKKVPNTDKRGGRRGKKDVIKSESVFSMGPAGKSTQGREGVRDAFGNDLSSIRKKSVNTTSDKSTSSSSTVRIHREEEEENDLGQIPNQTFVEDLFQDSRLPPVQLPLEHNVCRKLASKQVEKGPPDRKSQVDVTRESLDTAAKLFEHDSSDNYFFLQLPDCLPVTTDYTATSDVPNSSKGRDLLLSDVPEGYIGKLKIHKSGKVRLVLGTVSLDISMGTPCGFLQELVSIRSDSKITTIGQISHRLVCIPDFEDILATT